MGQNTTTLLAASINQRRTSEKFVTDFDESDQTEDTAAVCYTSFPKPQRTQPKSKRLCYYCGGSFQPRNLCPARERSCHNCGKQGYYAEVCRSSQSQTASKVLSRVTSTSDAQDERYLVTVSKSSFAAGAPNCLQRTVVDVTISGHSVKVLRDSGAFENFINKSLVEQSEVQYVKDYSSVTMASTQLHLQTQGQVRLNLEVQGRTYANTVLEVMSQACADVILGQKFLSEHEAVVFEFGEKQDQLVVHPTTPEKALCLTAAKVEALR